MDCRTLQRSGFRAGARPLALRPEAPKVAAGEERVARLPSRDRRDEHAGVRGLVVGVNEHEAEAEGQGPPTLRALVSALWLIRHGTQQFRGRHASLDEL